MTKRKQLTAEEFCIAWQKAESLSEFCKTTGYHQPRAASSRAAFYRRKGANLKRLTKNDYDAINKKLEELGL